MNLTNTLKLVTVIFLGALSMTGCSVKDNLDDMHDKTAQMAQTTQKLSDKTTDVLAASNELKELTQQLFFGGRTDATARTREQKLDAMVAAPDMPAKLARAGAYYYAQEFQSYVAFGLDDATELDALKTRAVEELYERVQSFYTKPEHFWESWLPLSDHTLDIYAVAAPMHYILAEQKALALKKGFQPISFLTLVTAAMMELKNNPTRDPASMPKWMYLIQKYKDITIDLLKARVTYLPFQLYAEVENLNALSKFGVWNRSRKDQKEWKLNLYEENLSEIARQNEYLDYSLQSRKLLADLGVEAQLDDSEGKSLKIQTIYRHLNLAPRPVGESELLTAQDAQIEKFKYLVHLSLAPLQEFLQANPETYVPPQQ